MCVFGQDRRGQDTGQDTGPKRSTCDTQTQGEKWSEQEIDRSIEIGTEKTCWDVRCCRNAADFRDGVINSTIAQ